MDKSKIRSAVVALVLVLTTSVACLKAQTKKEVQFSLDTLYRSHMKLQGEFSKLINVWKQYDAYYSHIKASMNETTLANEPIDKGIAMFNKVWIHKTERLKLLEDSTVFLVDSLQHLYEQQAGLLAQNELYLRLLTGELSQAAFPNTEKELIGSWQLFLNPMQVSGKAYESGLISHNPFTVADSIQNYNIYQLEFLPDELANVYFKDGRKQKCFFEVNNFKAGQPYTIDCTKQNEFKLTLHISPMPAGLEVSYEIPLDTTQVVYFNGLMKP